MSAAQHTAGPWTLDLSGAGSWAVYVEPTGDFDSHLTIARRGELNHRTAESEANARLIAAAPELLAEIEREYTELADFRNDWPGRDTPAGQAKLIRLRNLICKATGREQRDVQDDYGTRAAKATGEAS